MLGERRQKKFDDRILRRAIAKTKEDYADDDQREAGEAEAIEEAGWHVNPLSEKERRILVRLQSWARQAAHRADSKAEALVNWLDKNLKDANGWTNQRAILFTEYRTTQQWMQAILTARGFDGNRLKLIYGGMDLKERESVKAAFQANPSESPIRILLATDAASEGIDLQNHCHLMVHLEIPYNPNVMEQRNGRIDRHGQRADEVMIWHPVDAEGNRGDDILRALRKLDAMRVDVGSVNPVISENLPKLIEGRRRDLDMRRAEAKMKEARRFVKAERNLRERVAKLHERLDQTRQQQSLTPDRIECTVRTALRLADKPDLKPASLAEAPVGKVFHMPDELPGTWSRCLEGLEHPFTQKKRPVTFDHDVAKGRDDVVLIHLNHRLVQMSLRLLRAEIWAPNKKLHRVTVRSLSDGQIDDPAIVVMSRLVITGGNHHRLHEELTEAGGYLRDGSFRREERVTEIRRWLNESSSASLSDSMLKVLQTRFKKQRKSLRAAITVRSNERLRLLTNTIESRKCREVEDIRSVLDDLEKALTAEIAADHDPVQLSLWSEDERTQLTRDRSAIEARLARIPAEREQEQRAIEERHAHPKEHTFPVGIVLVVPETLALSKDPSA